MIKSLHCFDFQILWCASCWREQGLRNAFEAMDSDQDGFVTLVEFKQLMTKCWSQNLQPQPQPYFPPQHLPFCLSIFNLNHIIFLSIGTSEDDVEKLVAAMDVDGDGRVSYQEYLNSFRSPWWWWWWCWCPNHWWWYVLEMVTLFAVPALGWLVVLNSEVSRLLSNQKVFADVYQIGKKLSQIAAHQFS